MRKYQWLAYINHNIPDINGLIDVAEATCFRVCEATKSLELVPEMNIRYIACYSQQDNKVQIGFRTADHNSMWIAYFEYSERFGWCSCTNHDNMVSSYRCRIQDYVSSQAVGGAVGEHH